MTPKIPKLIFAVLATFYFLWIAYDPMQGSFLDNVDLPIHETGHLIFRPFGEFMMVAGGTLFQMIVPCVFAGYFAFWQRSYYSAAIVMLWAGQSLLNIWVYAADAVAGQLVLTSGMTGNEGGFHDWNYMLTATGMLDSTRGVAKVIRFAAVVTTLAASAAAVYFSFGRPNEEVEEI